MPLALPEIVILVFTGVVLTLICFRLLRWAVAIFLCEEPRRNYIPLPRFAVASVAGWLGFLLLNRFLASLAGQVQTPELSLIAVQIMFGLNLLIAVMLPVLLTDVGKRRLDEVGLSSARIVPQVRLGLCAFLTTIWPTAVLLVLSQYWRSVETEHAYLQTLRESTSRELIAWIAASAVVTAPLAEELLFRVTLQTWLTERLPSLAAIGLTAALFALIHGWRDALPLVPLAVILGYVYQRTRSYWACVVTHGLFNATNLLLATWTS